MRQALHIEDPNCTPHHSSHRWPDIWTQLTLRVSAFVGQLGVPKGCFLNRKDLKDLKETAQYILRGGLRPTSSSVARGKARKETAVGIHFGRRFPARHGRRGGSAQRCASEGEPGPLVPPSLRSLRSLRFHCNENRLPTARNYGTYPQSHLWATVRAEPEA